jgi:hypothetical protein
MERRPNPEHEQDLLDESIEESFPASDPRSSGDITPAPGEHESPAKT